MAPHDPQVEAITSALVDLIRAHRCGDPERAVGALRRLLAAIVDLGKRTPDELLARAIARLP
jgi:hypothetical protein